MFQVTFIFVIYSSSSFISSVPAICKCSDLKTTSLFMLTNDGSGIWTGHSRVACLCSTMSGASAGKTWIAKGNSGSWGLESSGGSLTHTSGARPGIAPKLGSAGVVNFSADTWHLCVVQGFSQHGAGFLREHPEREWAEDPRGSLAAFGDLVLEIAKHCCITLVEAVITPPPTCHFLMEAVPKNLGLF